MPRREESPMNIRCITARVVLALAQAWEWVDGEFLFIASIVWATVTVASHCSNHLTWWRAAWSSLAWGVGIAVTLVTVVLLAQLMVMGCSKATKWAKRTAEECRAEKNHL